MQVYHLYDEFCLSKGLSRPKTGDLLDLFKP